MAVKVRAVPALGGALLLLGVLALWGPGNEEDGGIEVGPRTRPCYRVVTFSANWGDKDVLARRVEWGQLGNTGHLENVSAPWQMSERVACASTVLLDVEFPPGVYPGRALCTLTVNGRVYDSDLEPEDRHPHCFVQEFIK